MTASINPDAFALGTWVVFKCCGFNNEDAARSAGQRFGDALLATGAVNKLGIDIGFSRTTLQFSEEIQDAVHRVSRRSLRGETHGLMTFEEGSLQVVGQTVRLTATISNDRFGEQMADWLAVHSNFTERQRNCAALINDSFFVANNEGQFILRISAVEALCDEFDVGSEYINAILSLETHLAGMSIDNTTRETVSRWFKDKKKISLRQSYMRKFQTLLSDESARAFDRLYGLRSKLLHDGMGRGQLTEATNQALDLAVAVYQAELLSYQSS